MDDLWSPVRIPDMSAYTFKDKVFFCPQRIERIEWISELVFFVVLDIIGSDDQHTLTRRGNDLFDEGGFTGTVSTKNDRPDTGTCCLSQRQGAPYQLPVEGLLLKKPLSLLRG